MRQVKLVIEPPSRLSFGFRELWQYRELFYFFTWRDIKVKYKQTYLGVGWAVLQPLVLMALFTFVFARNFNINTSNVRYEAFVLSGLILWNLFHSTVSNASESMVQHANIIKKIYFPRIIIPCASLLTALFDFLIAFILFFIFCLIIRQPLHWSGILFYPAAILLTILSSFGIGTFVSALNVKFRDFRYIIPFSLQFLFFATQIIYSLDALKQQWLKYLLALNPMNGAIELFRIPFHQSCDTTMVLISTASAFLFIFMGLIYFKKQEVFFADLA
jgi:lipopolysaccharide transport system permease protein